MWISLIVSCKETLTGKSAQGATCKSIRDSHKYYGEAGKYLQSTWTESKTLPKHKVILGEKTTLFCFFTHYFVRLSKEKIIMDYLLLSKGFRVQRKICICGQKCSLEIFINQELQHLTIPAALAKPPSNFWLWTASELPHSVNSKKTRGSVWMIVCVCTHMYLHTHTQNIYIPN